MPAIPSISSDQALGFRLVRHHLDQRLPLSRLEGAVAACGLQDTPPGMAVVALQARVQGLEGGELEDRYGRKDSLAKTWSLRGAPYVVARADFAAFTRGVVPEVVTVDFLDKPAWVLAKDLPALVKARPPSGLRLLPAQDPYLQQPRALLLSEKRFHPLVWRMIGKPGVVLVDGRIAGIWRSVKKGKEREVTLTAFGKLAGPAKKAAEAEARDMARVQGGGDLTVSWA